MSDICTTLLVEKSLDASPEKAWKIVGDFDGWANWHPVVKMSVADGDHVGAIRILVLADGRRISDRLVAYDEAAMTYSYVVATEPNPLPVADYRATITVVPLVSGCSVRWEATFNTGKASAQSARESFTTLFSQGLDRLEDLLSVRL
jgi:hypothetical protein